MKFGDNNNMKIGFYTLGCKVNQYETQAMQKRLAELGHTVCDLEADCGGYIINTCSVTAVADRKCRTVIRRCRREHPEAVIAVCGCYSQHAPDAVRALGVDLVGGSADREDFLQAFLATAADRRFRQCVDEPCKRRCFEILPAGGLADRTRAMLKVQDGCCNFCTYCIIPYTRGPIRSAPVELAVEQVKCLQAQGYREVVITGIEVASWGLDLPGKPPLESLLTAVCQAVPDLRIRLGSLEPRVVTEELCAALSALPNLCPQFHLSMQSGSDSVLRRMRRKYDTVIFLESVNRLCRTFPGCAITTDMIVGFPGETDAEFAESLAFIRKCAFSDMHIFPYSRRPGTPADKMPGQLSNEIKESRSHAAIAVAQEMNLAYRTAHVGAILPVLFEEADRGFFTGHTPNYLRVYVPEQALHNQIRSVRLTGIFRDGLQGELL